MASVISQLVSAVAGTLVKASVWNNEFLQIINLVSGVSTDKRMKVVCDDDTNGVLIINQQGDGPVADFQGAGVTVMKVPVSGTPTDATDITDKGYVDGRKIYTPIPTFFSGTPNAGDQSVRFISSNDNYYATEVRGVCKEKDGGNGGTLVFKVYKQDKDGGAPVSVATFTFDNTGAAIVEQKTYSQALTGTPVNLTTGMTLYVECDSNDDVKMRGFTIEMVIYGKPEA